jgi:hypothetical protein
MASPRSAISNFLPNRLLRFNWLIVPGQAMAARQGASTGREDFQPRTMPDIEMTEECHALIVAELAFEPIGRRLPNGNWQVPIDGELWQRLQKLRRRGESISDCIIRVIIITLHTRGSA